MSIVYFSTDPSTYDEVVQEEYFGFDTTLTRSHNELDEFVIGGPSTYGITGKNVFDYVKITLDQAITLGFTDTNPATFSNSTQGKHVGHGHVISKEAFPSSVQSIFWP